MKFKGHAKMLASLASFLLMLAPIVVVQAGCCFYWGEPECPSCLKNE